MNKRGSKMAASKLVKSVAFCGLGAVASFLPAGITAANASTTKTKPTPKVAKVAKPTAKKSGTFLGSAAMTQFGAVQVSVTVNNGKIQRVSVPVYPMGTFRDQQINAQAIPMLEQEVMQAQSSTIYGIGGASYTSQGFYDSLVSALAKAGMK